MEMNFMPNSTEMSCKSGIEYENKIVSMLLGLRFKTERVGKNDNGVDIFASKSAQDSLRSSLVCFAASSGELNPIFD